VAVLRAQGVPAQALPLIEIAAATDPAAASAWATLATRRMVVFVSPNGVARFFALRPAATSWPPQTWAAATGPGTSSALRAAGVPAALIVEPPHEAEQFDSEALWRRIGSQGWQGQHVLVVRGDGGREWLADRLREQGAQVAFVQAYRRVLPRLDARQRDWLAAALAAPATHWWLFSSSQAVQHLALLAPPSDWSSGCALASHPRIAVALHALGFASVLSVRPTLDAVVAAWRRSIQSTAAPDQRP
jgi:uroporphyrinogen-III synthase